MTKSTDVGSNFQHAPVDDRYMGIARDYSPEAVRRLQGSVHIEHTFAN